MVEPLVVRRYTDQQTDIPMTSLAPAFVFLAALAFGTSVEMPRSATAADGTCTSAAAIGPQGRALRQRFTAFRARYADWTKRDCFPQAYDAAALATITNPTGAIVDVNGHAALVVEPDRTWIGTCEGGSIVRAAPATGADLVALAGEMARIPGLGSLDVLEIGLARGQSPAGTPRYALYWVPSREHPLWAAGNTSGAHCTGAVKGR